MKEMQRTCKRDGTVWYVPIKAAKEKAPGRFQMAAAHTRAAGDRLSYSHKHVSGELQVSNLQAQAQRVQHNSSCPTCDSQCFTERKVRC